MKLVFVDILPKLVRNETLLIWLHVGGKCELKNHAFESEEAKNKERKDFGYYSGEIASWTSLVGGQD